MRLHDAVKRAAASSWIDTGRAPAQRTAIERERDYNRVIDCLDRGELPPPLLLRWFVNVNRAFQRMRAEGSRACLHRDLGLSDRPRRMAHREQMRIARANSILAIAAALPRDLKDKPRSEAVLELIHAPTLAGPLAVRGELRLLREGIFGPPPRSAKTIYRVFLDFR